MEENGIERTLKERTGLWLGYINDYGMGRLRSLVLLIPEVFDAFPFALITCVDGGRSEWVPIAFRAFTEETGVAFTPPYRILDNSILISGRDFRERVVADDFLGSMDEVWFYAEAPDTTPSPNVKLTSEGRITDDSHHALDRRQKAVIEWATGSGTLLGLGDGHGINFVTSNRHLAEQLIRLQSDGSK